MKRYSLSFPDAMNLTSGIHNQLSMLAGTSPGEPGQLDSVFLRFLSEAIDTEVNTHSVGCGWLENENNAKLFVRHCTSTDDFFYRLQSRESAKVVLESKTLLASVPHTRRETFILNMVRKGNLGYKLWYRWVINAGTPPETVANVILTLLRESEYPLDDYLHYCFVKDFRTSCGGLGFVSDAEKLSDASTCKIYVDEPNMWSVMTDEQLVEAIEICERIKQGALFDTAQGWCLYWTLEAYLCGIQRTADDRHYNWITLREVLLRACTNAKDLKNINVEIFQTLPTEAQRELIEKHKGVSCLVLITTALRLNDRDMFDRYFKEMKHEAPLWTYRFARAECKKYDGALSQHILQATKARFDSAGCRIAPVLIDEDNRAYAVVDGVRYVDPSGHSFREAASVMFDSHGTVVSEKPRIVKTNFLSE